MRNDLHRLSQVTSSTWNSLTSAESEFDVVLSDYGIESDPNSINNLKNSFPQYPKAPQRHIHIHTHIPRQYSVDSSSTYINTGGDSYTNESRSFDSPRFRNGIDEHIAESTMISSKFQHMKITKFVGKITLVNSITRQGYRRFYDRFSYTLVTSKIFNDFNYGEQTQKPTNNQQEAARINNTLKSLTQVLKNNPVGRLNVKNVNSVVYHNFIGLVNLKNLSPTTHPKLKAILFVYYIKFLLQAALNKLILSQILQSQLMNSLKAFLDVNENLKLLFKKTLFFLKNQQFFNFESGNNSKILDKLTKYLIDNLELLTNHAIRNLVKLISNSQMTGLLSEYCKIYNVDVSNVIRILKNFQFSWQANARMNPPTEYGLKPLMLTSPKLGSESGEVGDSSEEDDIFDEKLKDFQNVRKFYFVVMLTLVNKDTRKANRASDQEFLIYNLLRLTSTLQKEMDLKVSSDDRLLDCEKNTLQFLTSMSSQTNADKEFFSIIYSVTLKYFELQNLKHIIQHKVTRHDSKHVRQSSVMSQKSSGSRDAIIGNLSKSLSNLDYKINKDNMNLNDIERNLSKILLDYQISIAAKKSIHDLRSPIISPTGGSRRHSTGLQFNLLKVANTTVEEKFEEEEQEQPNVQEQAAQHDGNYLGICLKPESGEELAHGKINFNKAELEDRLNANFANILFPSHADEDSESVAGDDVNVHVNLNDNSKVENFLDKANFLNELKSFKRSNEINEINDSMEQII